MPNVTTFEVLVSLNLREDLPLKDIAEFVAKAIERAPGMEDSEPIIRQITAVLEE